MSAARPLSLLSAGAVVALSLAVPGTALADSGQGKGQQKQQAQDSRPGPQGSAGGGKAQAPEAERAEPKPARSASNGSASTAPGRSGAATGKPATKPGSGATGDRTARAGSAGAAAAAPRSGDPAGNNGTIKIDTVPGDPDRANRPHPGCSFVVQFFDFDAGQTADITLTGQAPTRSAGPLLTLSGQTISTTPADGALEEGHSLVLSAADLGLLGTPTAAKGWHVKVAVDALEAPGGAKQKVFWLDCAGDQAAVEEEPEEADVAGSGAADESLTAPADQVADERLLSAAGDDVAVLSGSATRSDVDTRDAALAGAPAEQQGRSTTSTLASVLPFAVPAALPFTGAVGVTGMLVAGLGAVAAGALALRAGRRRATA